MRLFLSIALPPRICRAFGGLQDLLRADLPEGAVAWNRNPHLTLRFFGEVGEESLDALQLSVVSVAAAARPFRLFPAAPGFFGPRSSPRVLWWGIAPSAPLCDLAVQVARIGGPEDEPVPYHPHLTLGRVKRNVPGLIDRLEVLPLPETGAFPVESVILYRSCLTPAGARHEPLLVAPFGTALTVAGAPTERGDNV